MERSSHIGLNDLNSKKQIGYQLGLEINNGLWWQLTIFKITCLLFTCQIYTLNFVPVVRRRWSEDSFIVPIYLKETCRKSISYLESKSLPARRALSWLWENSYFKKNFFYYFNICYFQKYYYCFLHSLFFIQFYLVIHLLINLFSFGA